jgi:Domain of unknown function (DUF4383)
MTTSDQGKMAGWAAKYAPVQDVAFAVGAVFLLVGILGFIPGITTNFDALQWAGHESGAMLFGVFAVSGLHNIVHMAFGVAGLMLARTFTGARGFLIGAGVIYLVLWLYGVVIDHGSAANFVPVNAADNWLHLGLAVGMIACGVALGGMQFVSRARHGTHTPPAATG